MSLVLAAQSYAAVSKDLRDDDIEIVEGGDRTIYEYRTNGVLMMIKVVPKHGPAYYMAPADGTPHYESLEHVKNLYPHWVILKF